MKRSRRRVGTIGLVTLLSTTLLLPVGAAAAEPPAPSTPGVFVEGIAHDPEPTRGTGRPRPGVPPAAVLRASGLRPAGSPADAPAILLEEATQAPEALEEPASPGIAALSFRGEMGYYGPPDATGAVIGSWLLEGTRDRISTYLLTPGPDALQMHLGWDPDRFFALPGSEYYWPPVVGGSIRTGRFVAAMASWADSCGAGYLNLAVSTSSDPTKTWIRYRIPLAGAWADNLSLGVSDDKVVIASDDWRLDAADPQCLGSTYVGSRLRVVDWADLLDGGSVLVRDVTPAPAVERWGWLAASNVPGTATTAAGNDVHAIGTGYVDGAWGQPMYGRVVGSARSGTASFVGAADLGAAGLLDFVGPPDSILAFASGNGYQDARPVSAAWRAGRFAVSANDTCKLTDDPEWRACARFIEIDTGGPTATVVESVMFTDLGRDSFNPLVGWSRDGSLFGAFAGADSSAPESIEAYVVEHGSGGSFAASTETQIHTASTGPAAWWSTTGSIIPDPTGRATAWVVEPYMVSGDRPQTLLSRVTRGLTGDPGGTMVLNRGRAWAPGYEGGLELNPDPASPIVAVRLSSSPLTEDTPGGKRLVLATERYSTPRTWLMVNDPTTGGTTGVGPHTVYVQWRTGDGRYSTPISASMSVDTSRPSLGGLGLRFALLRSVGSTVAVRLDWVCTDVPSGPLRTRVVRTRISSGASATTTYPAPTSYAVQSLATGISYRLEAECTDHADQGSGLKRWPTTKIRTSSESAATYRSTWGVARSSKYLGGAVRYSTRAGARATFRTTARSVALVATRGRDRGKAEIWVDGAKAATIDLYASSRQYRRVVWQTTWPISSEHTIQVRVLGTKGRPRVDVDGFLAY